MKGGLIVSATLHLVAVVVLVVWTLLFGGRTPPLPAADPPGIDVVMGEAAAEKGESAAESPAPAPEPAPDPPPEPPPAPPADPAPAVPPAAPEPEPPPPEPAAPEPPPPPPAPAIQPPRIQAPAIPPMAPPSDVPPAPPAVRLGTLDPGFTSIDDPNKIATPATPQTGNQPPVYPREAERRQLQGTVVLRVQIGADGRATQVDVIESSGHRLLDDAARARLMIWRYRPARRPDGTAAPDVIEIGINFQLH